MTNSPKKNVMIDGYDPLSTTLVEEDVRNLAKLQQKRTVQNILKSYTGTYDVFSEMLQNALDAIQMKWVNATSKKQDYQPKLWIDLEIKKGRIRITDNGIGMDVDEFKYCFTPFLSFKDENDLTRGYKGVGATFLAYGYNYIRMESLKTGQAKLAAVLRGGRTWAESSGTDVPPPKLESTTMLSSHLKSEESGTAVEILVSKTEGSRPKDLGWLGATNAKQWSAVLRMKTPLGGIYLDTPKYKPQIEIRVTDAQGNVTTNTSQECDYLYPHEFGNFRVQMIRDIEAKLNSISGDAQTKYKKLAASFKRLDIMWDLWSKKDLLDDKFPFETILSDDEKQLIEQYNVTIYFAFLSSAKMWTQFNDDILKLRKGMKLLKGGLIITSDSMVQGEPIVIPLTSAIGYQANSHAIVHFDGGDPDMGRKTFQPELTNLAESLAVRSVTIAKRFLSHVRPDTGASTMSSKKALHDWIRTQENHHDTNPFVFSTSAAESCLISMPQQEQDVIALFHELLGLGVLKGYKFFATSQSDTYDSLFSLSYADTSYAYKKGEVELGVSPSIDFPFQSEPKVLEYKYDFDALIRDFEKDIKAADQIDLVVCWAASQKYRELYYLESNLIPGQESGRDCFGSTHSAFRPGNSQKDFEVVVLNDLFGFIEDPVKEAARQKILYLPD